jgi:hypothetical protein
LKFLLFALFAKNPLYFILFPNVHIQFIAKIALNQKFNKNQNILIAVLFAIAIQVMMIIIRNKTSF